MTSKEILVELINLGVVHVIGEEYFVTHRVNEIFEKTDDASSITLKEHQDPRDFSLYPETIRCASIENKVKTILDYCEVPEIVTRGNSKFMVRSFDGLTKTSVLKIMKNTKYVPAILLKAIKDYYAYMEFPKAFKRFVSDGDIFSMYTFYENGNSLDNPEKPNNEVCL